MDNAKVQVKFTGETKNLDNATSKASKSLQGFKSFAKGLGASIAGVAATAATTATAMLVDVSKKSLQARADLEQNLGGVETLFKENADKVVANAKKAYQTAGISANQYMEQATSFSAVLVRNLGGDTKKAAELTDMAIRDMSDNANKMGTDISMIQSAYQGLARGNATMLDNLKVGYGGTKTELLKLAQDMGVVDKSVKSFNDISFEDSIQAIHKVQEQLGITGTTAKEATETISGSVNTAKAAWQNFLSGTIDTKDLIKTIITAAKNIGKELLKIIPDIAQGLVELINGLVPYIPPAMKKLIPVLIKGILDLTMGLVPMLPQIINMLLQGLIQIISALADALPDLLPQIVEAILDIIPVLIDNLPLFIEAGIKLIVGLALGIVQSTPKLLGAVVNIVNSIVKFFLNLPSMLFNIARNTMLQFGNVFVTNANAVYNKAKNLASKVINGIKAILTPGGLKNIGKNLISGLWNGIKSKFDSVIEGVKNLASKLPKAVKKVLGIASPSKVMFKLGGYTTEGFINGIDSLKAELDRQMVNTFSLSPNVTNSASTHFSPNVNVINNIDVKQDPLGQMVNNIKTFSGGAKNDYNYGKA
jgi:phage-related protein